MARYWVTSPVSYVKDNRVVVLSRVPVVVELDDDVAAELGSAVRAVNENPDVAPPVEAPAEVPERPRRHKAEVKPEPAADGE